MMRFNSSGLLLAAAAFVSMASPAVGAVSAVSVGGDVVAHCLAFTPGSTTMTFPSYVPLTDAAASTSFTTRCTKEATSTVTFSVSGGSNFNNAATIAGDRALKDAGGNILSYQLYRDSAHTTAWAFNATTGAGAGVTQTTLGNSVDMSLSIFGLVPHGQELATVSNTYTDTVTLTVNY